MAYADQEEVFDRLEQLAEYPTISSFTLAYYELIADYVSGESRDAQQARRYFLDFLKIVQRYHRALDVFTSEDQVTLGNVRSAAEKRDIALHVLVEQLGAHGNGGNSEAVIGRCLLSAECYYQLGMVEQVVERLEAALEAGADHPLVQFALGYNRYELATRAFTRYSPETGQREIDDYDRFRLACLSAVSAFQDGLSGDSFDGHIYWWIGNVLKAAGFEEAAQASFDRAEQILTAWDEYELDEEDYLGFDWIEEEKPTKSEEAVGPITEDEVRQVGLLLRRSFNVSDILNE